MPTQGGAAGKRPCQAPLKFQGGDMAAEAPVFPAMVGDRHWCVLRKQHRKVPGERAKPRMDCKDRGGPQDTVLGLKDRISSKSCCPGVRIRGYGGGE